MITKAKREQANEIRDIWRICFPQEDKKYTDYYFKNMFDPDSCYIVMEDNKVVSCVIRNIHAMMFNGRVIQSSMILGVATLPNYRHQGYMHQLMDVVIDACEHTELLTTIQTNTPSLYEDYGFKNTYRRTQYTIKREDCKRTNNFGCSFEPTAIDLLKVYSAFIRKFNGFYARDLKYFVNYIKEVRARGGKVAAYYNGKNQIMGYAMLLPKDNQIYVEEIVYLDAEALLKLCNMALQEKKIVNLFVSEAEELERIFGDVPRYTYEATMLKLNDSSLMSKLYDRSIKSVDDVIKMSTRPLNLNESA